MLKITKETKEILKKVAEGINKKKLQLLNEYSFSRVYNKLKNGTCAMMTAYRGTNSHTENERRQKSLKQELQKLGYSFNEFNGYYIEYTRDSEAKPQLEKSLLIYPKSLKDFKENIIELGTKYDQDTILYIKDGEGFLIGATGNDPDFPKGQEVSIGKVTASKIAQIYSERNGKTFIFESMQPDGMFSGYAFKATENNRITENDTMKEAKEKIEAKIKSLIERGETPFIKENQELTNLLNLLK